MIEEKLTEAVDDAEYQLEAVAYMYGKSMPEAKKMLSSLSKEELRRARDYYDLEGLPVSMRIKIMKERDEKAAKLKGVRYE